MAMLRSSRPLFPLKDRFSRHVPVEHLNTLLKCIFNLISASILGRIRLYNVYAPTILVVVSILGLKIFSKPVFQIIAKHHICLLHFCNLEISLLLLVSLFIFPVTFLCFFRRFKSTFFSHILSSNRPAALWFCGYHDFPSKRQLSFPLTLSPAAFLSVSFCSHSFSLLVSIQPPIKRIAWDTIRSANLQHPEWFSIIINIFYKFIRLGASQPKQIPEHLLLFIYFLFHFILYHCHDVILLVLIFALHYR